MGRVKVVGLSVLAVFLTWSVGVTPAAAQTKEARGTAVAVSDSSLTVKVADKEMKFTVDAKTVVGAPGAGRATRDAQAKGETGIKLTNIVKTGSGVIVTYREANGAMVATEVRSVPAATAGSAAPSANSTSTATGKVKSATGSTLVITDNGKDSTFTVDSNTKVLGKGAGTATRQAGGTISFATLVGVGDTVSVSYTGSGQAMHATEVRVTVDASRKPTPAGR
jgi:hypothetical protein